MTGSRLPTVHRAHRSGSMLRRHVLALDLQRGREFVAPGQPLLVDDFELLDLLDSERWLLANSTPAAISAMVAGSLADFPAAASGSRAINAMLYGLPSPMHAA